jgi:hypothetical protein
VMSKAGGEMRAALACGLSEVRLLGGE